MAIDSQEKYSVRKSRVIRSNQSKLRSSGTAAQEALQRYQARKARSKWRREMHWVERWLQKAKILEASTGPLTECQGHIIDSCLARGDLEQARKNIQYWNEDRAKPRRPTRSISKWVPGNHFYALNDKFSSLELAIKHLELNGYQFDGTVRERFQYRENGG